MSVPFVSVLIPTLNEASHIEACLRSLADQSYPEDRFEVVVIDNGSTDETSDLVQHLGVRLLHEPRKSAYWARNFGIQQTRGDYLAFTDADCIVEPNWLSNLVDCAIENEAGVVGGLIEYEMVTDTLGNRLLVETHRPEQIRVNIEISHSVAGGNMLVHRDAFKTLGQFNVVAWGSDIEFSKRAAAAGLTVSFAENAIVRHQCDLGNWEYWRRSYETRFGQVLLFDDRSGWMAAIKNLVRFPWKPGLRSGQNRFRTETIQAAPFVTDWLYRWGNRWMEFFGEQVAILTKNDSGRRQPRFYDHPGVQSPGDAAFGGFQCTGADPSADRDHHCR